ncbi:MAG: NADH-quinone oxidoreductase subunit F [Veillonellaceae bacterium]|nr:NADH-quinone oxidoreductase subunit F [Veillonellaceae bacterium]
MISYIEIESAKLRGMAENLLKTGQSRLTAMFANDERTLNGGMAIYCIFADKSSGKHLCLKTLLNAEPFEFPSLVPVTPAAAWFEREIHDLFGLIPIGHPDLRPLVLHENWPAELYPLRKDFDQSLVVDEAHKEYAIPEVKGEGVFEVPVGPIHAGIIEPGHFRFSQAGENIINLEAKLFYTHRGIEKAVEGLPIETAFYQAERICGVCTVSHALAFAQAVESIAKVTIPERAEHIRVLMAELERLYNHIGDIGNLCAGVGFAVGISHGSRIKEMLVRLNEILTGNRFLRGMVTLGGVNMDITDDMAAKIQSTLRLVEADFKELVSILKQSGAFLDRINTTGILPRQAAVDLAVVGVAARASGVDADVRRDFPYSLYSELDFKVPIQASGDVAARLWVRVDEVTQTISIIRQVLSSRPPKGGPLTTVIPELPPHKTALGWSESARGSNIHWLMTGKDNTVYRLFVRSASYANWPSLTVAVPGNIIPDFPLINKSFELCYACTDR